MNPQQRRRAALDRQYKKNREMRLVRARGKCELQAPGCTQTATETHHVVKRSHLLMHDVENLRACCHSCNQWVENNPRDAETMGFVETRWPQIERRA